MKRLLLFLVALGLLISSVACKRTTETIIPVTRVSITPNNVVLVIGESSTLAVTVEPDDATDKTVTWTSSDDGIAIVEDGKVTGIAEGSATISAIAGDKKATCSVSVIIPGTTMPEAVDLGLSVKWASFNVGANAPEESGHYFAWGETTPKENYTWSTYKWIENGKLTKYCTNDEPRILEPADDAAHVTFGGEWRMPTRQEIRDLIEYCDWTQTEVNGTKGWVVSSLIEGYTDKSIFLPSAGAIDGKEKSKSCRLWSSEYPGFTTSESACNLYCSGDEFPPQVVDSHENYKCWGMPVRAVIFEENHGKVPVMSIKLNMQELELLVGETASLKAEARPSWATNNVINWTSTNSEVVSVNDGIVTALAEGTASIIASADGKEAVCTVKVIVASGIDESIAVDMGLSVKWAPYNLGASVPEERGDYYAWGELTPKEQYDETTYRWMDNGKLLKYCDDQRYWAGPGGPDMKGVLDAEDDAATSQLGAGWRMPTEAEMQELIDNCDVSRSNINGIEGYSITSRITGNSIFLPTTGYMERTELKKPDNVYLRSSLRSRNHRYAGTINFSGHSAYVSGLDRVDGVVIRPVYGDFIHVASLSIDKEEAILSSQGSSVLLSTSLLPINASEPCTYWVSDNRSVAEIDDINHEDGKGVVRARRPGTATVTAYTADGNVSSSCKITVRDGFPIPDAIDLGLSVKWASCNLGADKPEEFGGHWAWGEIDQKDFYDWDNYNYDIFPQDAAVSKLGREWRIPSIMEFEELMDNCAHEWTSVNGVSGMKLTSNINGDSIFLPAAGFWGWYNSAFNDLNGVGKEGRYWSSSRPDQDGCIVLNSEQFGASDSFESYYGLSIRPVLGGQPTITSISINWPNVYMTTGHSVNLFISSTPLTDASLLIQDLIVNIEDESKVILESMNEDGSLTITAIAVGETTMQVRLNDLVATCSISVDEDRNGRILAVDLGLSVKWSSFNLGANNPEEFGAFYAWGEIEPKRYYDFNNYKFTIGGDIYNPVYSKYNVEDAKTVLDLEDDAASQSWGSPWRIPTETEWYELIGECDWTWTTLNGVEGYRITGPSNNSIFLPPAGTGSDDSAGIFGMYWSSSRSVNSFFNAFPINIFRNQDFWGYSDGLDRWEGYSIRPIMDK